MSRRKQRAAKRRRNALLQQMNQQDHVLERNRHRNPNTKSSNEKAIMTMFANDHNKPVPGSHDATKDNSLYKYNADGTPKTETVAVAKYLIPMYFKPNTITQGKNSVLKDTLADLYEILATQRAPDGRGETYVINKFIKTIPNIQKDGFGNFYVRIGDAPILWSAHTDTVHRTDHKQQLYIDDNGIISLRGHIDFKTGQAIMTSTPVWSGNVRRDIERPSLPNCLGADDGAGLWLLFSMIKAGVEGLYVFHRKEESGGQGSQFLIKNTPDLVKDIDFAIAFDRRATKSIITHQGGARTCSDAFADSMAVCLNMGHIKDAGGSFTDTKNYRALIGECTNISAGYQSEHTSNETLDTIYLQKLLEHICKADFNNLVVAREPSDKDEYKSAYSGASASGYQGNGSHYYGNHGGGRNASNLVDYDYEFDYEYADIGWVNFYKYREIARVMKKNMIDVARILADIGYDEKLLMGEIKFNTANDLLEYNKEKATVEGTEDNPTPVTTIASLEVELNGPDIDKAAQITIEGNATNALAVITPAVNVDKRPKVHITRPKKNTTEKQLHSTANFNEAIKATTTKVTVTAVVDDTVTNDKDNAAVKEQAVG